MGDEETAIGKKIGEEERRKDETVGSGSKWDGEPAKDDAAGSGFRPGPPAGLVTLQVSLSPAIQHLFNSNLHYRFAVVFDRNKSRKSTRPKL